jgi:hypothetical protein
MASEQEEVEVRKRLVLDANILLRGVFGIRVRSLLEAYESSVSFYAPDICFDDARKYIPNLAMRRKFDPTAGLVVLDALSKLVEPVDISLYESYEELARVRISSRDCHAAFKSRIDGLYLSTLSAFLPHSHCTEITDVCI